MSTHVAPRREPCWHSHPDWIEPRIEQRFSIASKTRKWENGGVKTNLKSPNEKARALFKKLQALAERGIDGEKISAQKKLARLKARFDFAGPDPAETPDLFQ